MKFNFRKVASVIASAVMLGSTIGIAAAANYPAPFVAGGSSDVAIVYGSSAALTDGVAYSQLIDDMQLELAKQTISSSTASTVTASGGDSVRIDRTSNHLYINTGWGDVLGASLTSTDLKTLLADGKFYNKQNTEYKFNQKMDLGNITFTHFADSDYNNKIPALGSKLSANAYVMNYTLDFITDPESVQSSDLTDFEGKNIQFLGKNYYILDFKNGTTSTTKITLLDTANSAVISEGETKTVKVADQDYTVAINFITSDEIILTVNGENTDKMSASGTTYGNTYKLSDGTYVGIKSINVQDYAGGTKNAEFSLGKGKLEITDRANVKLNDKTIEDMWAYIALGTSSSKRTWQKLVLTWQIQDKAFLTPNTDLVMPGLEAAKITMGNTTVPDKEITTIDFGSSDYMLLKTTIKDGDVSIPLYYISTTTGNITGVGQSTTQRLAGQTGTNYFIYNATSSSAAQNDGFIASWATTRDAESYYLRATVRYDADGVRNLTTIKNKVTGDTLCEDLTPAQTCTIGNVVLIINKIDYVAGSERVVNMSINSGGSFNTLYTKDGLKVSMPWLNYTIENISVTDVPTTAVCNGTLIPSTLNNQINIRYWFNDSKGATDTGTCYPNTYTLKMYEANKDGDINSGNNVNISFTTSGTTTFKCSANDIVGDGTQYETGTSTKVWESYVGSPLATKFTQDKTNSDQYSVTAEYHKGPLYANVFVAAPSVSVSGSSGTTSSGGTSLSAPVVADSAVSSVQSGNLIVVGGSCVNTVAAALLGSSGKLCGADFKTKTGVDSGSFLIESFQSPYASNKIALLVAGYDAADTTKAATYLKTLGKTQVDTTVGKKYVGSTETSASLVTTSA